MPPENLIQAEYDAFQKFIAMQEQVALKMRDHKKSYDELLDAQVLATRALRDFGEIYRKNLATS